MQHTTTDLKPIIEKYVQSGFTRQEILPILEREGYSPEIVNPLIDEALKPMQKKGLMHMAIGAGGLVVFGILAIMASDYLPDRLIVMGVACIIILSIWQYSQYRKAKKR